MEPVHIRARKGDIAERVVVVGDPARIKVLLDYLRSPRLVNDNRGYLVYTGYYGDTPISLAVHGIGSGSAAIVIEELIMLGARVIVRLGTCGGMVRELDIDDIVIPSGAAYYCGGIFQQYIGESVCHIAVPSYEVLDKLVNSVKRVGRRFLVAPIVSCDAFYTEKNFVEKWSDRGAVAVDMETAIIFILGLLKRIKVGSILIVSNSLVKPSIYALASELEKYVREIAPAVLDAIVEIDTGKHNISTA